MAKGRQPRPAAPLPRRLMLLWHQGRRRTRPGGRVAAPRVSPSPRRLASVGMQAAPAAAPPRCRRPRARAKARRGRAPRCCCRCCRYATAGTPGGGDRPPPAMQKTGSALVRTEPRPLELQGPRRRRGTGRASDMGRVGGRFRGRRRAGLGRTSFFSSRVIPVVTASLISGTASPVKLLLAVETVAFFRKEKFMLSVQTRISFCQ